MTQRVIEETSWEADSGAHLLRVVARVIGRAKCYRVFRGGLSDSAELVERLLGPVRP